MSDALLSSVASCSIMPAAFAEDGVVAAIRQAVNDMPVFSDGPSPEEVAAICAMIAKRPHSATVREWAQALAARIADARD